MSSQPRTKPTDNGENRGDDLTLFTDWHSTQDFVSVTVYARGGKGTEKSYLSQSIDSVEIFSYK